MSVLIKGMDMPTGCYTCPIIYSEDGVFDFECPFNPYLLWHDTEDVIRYRPDSCPLVEVPTPHGRLIDAEKAAHSILMMSSHPCGCSIENVKDVVEWLRFVNGDGNNFAFPTIIEAEVSKQ